MIAEIMTLENMKKLINVSDELRQDNARDWKQKYDLLVGAIRGLEDHLERQFAEMEAEYEKEHGGSIH